MAALGTRDLSFTLWPRGLQTASNVPKLRARRVNRVNDVDKPVSREGNAALSVTERAFPISHPHLGVCTHYPAPWEPGLSD